MPVHNVKCLTSWETHGAVTLQPATNGNQLYASFLFWINNWRQGHSHHKWVLVMPTADPAGHLRGPLCTIAHVQYPLPRMQGNIGAGIMAGHLWMKTTPRDIQYIAKKMQTVLFSIKIWIYFIIIETFLCNSCNSGCFRNSNTCHSNAQPLQNSKSNVYQHNTLLHLSQLPL